MTTRREIAAPDLDAPTPAETTMGRRLGRIAANVGLALTFFAGVVPSSIYYGSGIADLIWAAGAILMGLLSLIRLPPTSSTVTPFSIAATWGMMLMPAMMRLSEPSKGALYAAAVGIELAAVVITQIARLYLGRRFGLLPANRGIVTSGPFRFVRHPVYAGWLLLMAGFTMAHPSLRNTAAVGLAIPFMVWRIAQEESLLGRCADYQSYIEKTRFRLIPGLV